MRTQSNQASRRESAHAMRSRFCMDAAGVEVGPESLGVGGRPKGRLPVGRLESTEGRGRDGPRPDAARAQADRHERLASDGGRGGPSRKPQWLGPCTGTVETPWLNDASRVTVCPFGPVVVTVRVPLPSTTVVSTVRSIVFPFAVVMASLLSQA